jgi:hypothetical protein
MVQIGIDQPRDRTGRPAQPVPSGLQRLRQPGALEHAAHGGPYTRRRIGDYQGVGNARGHGLDGVWRNKLRDCAVPLTKLQSHVLRLLAAGRSPDSYIAGGVAINRDGPRFSADIDIFQDSEDRLERPQKPTPRPFERPD